MYAQIHLHALNTEKNTFRGYTLILSYDLFQNIHLQIFYGRLSRLSHKRSISFSSIPNAFETLQKILQKRLSSFNRIGCCYSLEDATIDVDSSSLTELESLMDLLSLFPRRSSPILCKKLIRETVSIYNLQDQ